MLCVIQAINSPGASRKVIFLPVPQFTHLLSEKAVSGNLTSLWPGISVTVLWPVFELLHSGKGT